MPNVNKENKVSHSNDHIISLSRSVSHRLPRINVEQTQEYGRRGLLLDWEEQTQKKAFEVLVDGESVIMATRSNRAPCVTWLSA